MTKPNLFHDDELTTVQGRTVVLIAGRLRVAREILPKLQLDCQLLEHNPDHAIVKVMATWDGGSSAGLGISITVKEKPHMQRWSVCLAETRARHRALAAAGVGPEFYGAEEISPDDQDEPAPRPLALPPTNPAPKGPPWRKALSDRMVRMFGSVDQAIQALQQIAGHRSTSTLDDQDQQKLTVALDLIQQNGCDIDATRRIVRDFFKLPWFNEMSEADFDVIRNTMNGPRPPHTTTGTPPF